MTGSLVWRCPCRAVNYNHWETCMGCGGLKPAPPPPPPPKNDLKSIEQDANKGHKPDE